MIVKVTKTHAGDPVNSDRKVKDTSTHTVVKGQMFHVLDTRGPVLHVGPVDDYDNRNKQLYILGKYTTPVTTATTQESR